MPLTESVLFYFVGRPCVLLASIEDLHICCFQVCAKYMITLFIVKHIFNAGIN